MGATPLPPSSAAAAILPETVAKSFTRVYYSVAAQQPARLRQLYGDDSEVSHTAAIVLVGLPRIAAAAMAHPLANKPAAAVHSLDAMGTGAGGYVVLVTGALEGAPFTQTFVLCPAEGDKVGHFYCRNDIFRFIGAAGKAPAAAKPADVLVAPRATPVQVAAADGGAAEKTLAAGSPAAAADITAAASEPAGEDGGFEDGEDGGEDDGEDDGDETEDDDDDEDAAEEASPAGAAAAQGGVLAAVHKGAAAAAAPVAAAAAAPPAAASAPVTAASATVPAQGAAGDKDTTKRGGETSADDAPVKRANGSVAGASTAPASAAAAPPNPDVPAKAKTWASIVSTTLSAPALTAAATVAAAAATTSAPTGSGPVAAAAAGSSSTADPAVVKAADATGVAPVYGGGPGGKSAAVARGASHAGGAATHHHHHNHHHHAGNNAGSGSEGWSSVDSKRHSASHHGPDGGFQRVTANGHHGHQTAGYKHSQPRMYGPSAVIQLSSLPMDRAKDWRTLQQEFTAEFNSYGHPVRNVEVKTHKGLAFIEYDDAVGVRAAVAAWADGARPTGPFKDVELSVSEKRQRRPHLPGDGGPVGRGMGRGGMRGGGRGGGRGRGRGMSVSTGSGPGPHPSSSSGPPPAATTS
jgi:hypothetical protein